MIKPYGAMLLVKEDQVGKKKPNLVLLFLLLLMSLILKQAKL